MWHVIGGLVPVWVAILGIGCWSEVLVVEEVVRWVERARMRDVAVVVAVAVVGAVEEAVGLVMQVLWGT
jgi:hypothetical protein